MRRQFENLYKFEQRADGLFLFGGKELSDHPALLWRRDGDYVLLEASYGPMVLNLRLPADEVTRALGALRPVNDLQLLRQVGSANAYAEVGLLMDGSLVVCPRIVGDARGTFGFNLSVGSEARGALYRWLNVTEPSDN